MHANWSWTFCNISRDASIYWPFHDQITYEIVVILAKSLIHNRATVAAVNIDSFQQINIIVLIILISSFFRSLHSYTDTQLYSYQFHFIRHISCRQVKRAVSGYNGLGLRLHLLTEFCLLKVNRIVKGCWKFYCSRSGFNQV